MLIVGNFRDADAKEAAKAVSAVVKVGDDSNLKGMSFENRVKLIENGQVIEWDGKHDSGDQSEDDEDSGSDSAKMEDDEEGEQEKDEEGVDMDVDGEDGGKDGGDGDEDEQGDNENNSCIIIYF